MRENIKRSIDLYVSVGRPTGGFLRAVLEHRSVFDVFALADEENMRDMMEILRYIYNELPGNCHGAPYIVEAWIDAHRPADVLAEERGVTGEERAGLGVGGGEV